MSYLKKVLCVAILKQRLKSFQVSSAKLSYIHNVSNEPLQFKTIGSLIETTSKKHPDTVVFISKQQNKKITYRELLTQVDQFAAGLRVLGLEYGDRIGIWAPNIIEWVVVKLAAARAGLILVTLNPVYEAQEMEYSIKKVKIKAIVCPDTIKHMNYCNILDSLVGGLHNHEPNKINSQKVPSLKCVITISDKSIKGTYNYNEVLKMADDQSIKNIQTNQHRIQPDDPSSIQFSSGTTGQPKATILSHFSMFNNSFFISKGYEMDQVRRTACVQVPFFHVFGEVTLIGSLLHHETTAVLPSKFYNPVENLKAIQDERCDLVFGTPTMYVDLINVQRETNLDINLDIAVSGGSPCSPSLFKQMKDVLKVKKVKSIYGLTETTSVVFQSLINEDENKAFTTVGHVVKNVEVKVVDSDNRIVPFGSPGELCVRGYCNMLGYWDDEEKTKQTVGQDRWLHTGDQFILENDGYGRVVGRLKDMIIRGGENIFPKEIEDFLNTHPDILESYVIGLPHERLGEEVCACTRIRKDSNLTLESLTQFCKGNLAKFKIPTVLKLVDAFPKTQSGKIQKYALRQMFSK